MFLKISLVHWKIFFTYFSIKFDNLYWKWKWQKWILFYERSLSIKFKELLLSAVCIYKLSNKKLCISMCVYIIKKRVCIYMCVWGIILINILMLQLAAPPPPPPKKKKFWLCPYEQGLPLCNWAMEKGSSSRCCFENLLSLPPFAPNLK